MLFMSRVCHTFASVHCCLVVTCWEMADLLALVCDAYCIFVTFPCCILGQVWYLIVSFPDRCHLSYFGLAAFSRKGLFVTNTMIETRSYSRTSYFISNLYDIPFYNRFIADDFIHFICVIFLKMIKQLL